MFLLTTETGFLFPFAWVLGKIFNFLFQGVDAIPFITTGVLGICVILFTIVVRLILLPLTIKQQKFSNLSSMMQPEIQAVQAKYKDKRDNESVMKMNEETKAIYAKYGTSPTGGCLITLIQLPIMFALYRVIYKVPGYVQNVKNVCETIFNQISSNNLFDKLDPSITDKITPEMTENVNKGIDAVYNLSSKQLDTLTQLGNTDINTAVGTLKSYTNFLGISLTDSPGWPWDGGWHWSWAFLIPILAGVTQFFSVKLMERKQKLRTTSANESNNPMGSMKIMNMIMPLISAVFCFTFPACVGVYWITSSVVQIIVQLVINISMKDVDVEALVQKNIDKINAKRAKKGLPPKKIENTATSYVEQVKRQDERDARKAERDEEIKESTSYYSNTTAKPGSLAAKAGMVRMYNERNNKKDE